jgi:hypothetical protein
MGHNKISDMTDDEKKQLSGLIFDSTLSQTPFAK